MHCSCGTDVAGGKPGTIYWFDLRDELHRRDTRSPHCLSLHEWSLMDSLRVAAVLGWLPHDVRLLGAEPAALMDGLELSPVLAVAMRRIVALLGRGPMEPSGCAAQDAGRRRL